MGGIVTGITDAVGLTDSQAGARASAKAAGVQTRAQERAMNKQIAMQQEALGYLKEREALPRQFSEAGLSQLAGLYNLPGGDPDAMQRLQESGIYQAALGDRQAQEEAILRNQSATGALRTGDTDAMLAENEVARRWGATQAGLGGLQSMSRLPSNANQIAGAQQGIGQTYGAGIRGIGQTQAQGIIGTEQSSQAGQQAAMNEIGQFAQFGMAMFCDPALKDNARKIGEFMGFNIYTWEWNDKAAELGLYGAGTGPMADEFEAVYPDRVEIKNGYKHIKAVAQ